MVAKTLSIDTLAGKISKEELETLQEDLSSETNQSYFYILGEVSVFINRELRVDKENLSFQTQHFILFEHTLWLYETDQKCFLSVDNINSGDGWDTLCGFLEEQLDRNVKIIQFYSNEAQRLEDLLYDRKVSPVFMDTWFDLKKDAALIERYFERQVFVFKHLLKMAEKREDIPQFDFNDLANDVQIALNRTTGILSRLDNLHHYYSSIKNDKLNRNIYLLTLVSGVFLPLNLIVGFFGMNTEGLFFAGNPEGTLWVVYLLAALIATMIIGLPFMRIIDRLFLRWLLGRTLIYRGIKDHLAKIDRSLRG